MKLPIVRSSGLHHRLCCPGQIPLKKALYAANLATGMTFQGWWCHWHAALELAQFGGVGDLSKPEELPRDWDPPSRGFAEWMVDYYLTQVLAGAPANHALLIEQAFSQTFAKAFTLSGHIDALAVLPDATVKVGEREAISYAHGWDLKTGRIPVTPANRGNWQVASYAVLVHCEWPEMEEFDFDIVQPTNDEEAGFLRVSTVRFSRAELVDLKTLLIERVQWALAHENLLRTTWDNCATCPIALRCPAIWKDMELELTDELIKEAKALPNDQLARMTLLRKKFTKPLNEAADELRERLYGKPALTAHGMEFLVTERGGQYDCKDNQAVHKVLTDPEEGLGIAQEDYFAGCVSHTVDGIRRTIKRVKNLPMDSRKEEVVTAKKVFDDELGALFEQQTNKVMLIRKAEGAK